MPSQLSVQPDGFTAITIGGVTYRLDRKQDSHLLKATLPRFQAAHPVVDELKWDEIDLFEIWNPPILDQVQNGCVGHGGSTAFSIAWAASGQDMPSAGFSPTWAYALINGGMDEGAQIGDLIAALQNDGEATDDVFPESAYFLGGSSERAARPIAELYKLDEAYQISTWEELGTAIHMGYPVAHSVMVGNDFVNLDRDGFVPVDPGWGNHCETGGGIRRFRGKIGVKDQNSWGLKKFGINGCSYISKDHVLSQGDGFSGVAFCTVKRKPGSPVPPSLVV